MVHVTASRGRRRLTVVGSVALLLLAVAAASPASPTSLVEDFYHGVHDSSFDNVFTQGRRMGDGGGNTAWESFADTAAAGNTGPIEIALNYELASGKDGNQTCSQVGQRVRLTGYDEDAAAALGDSNGWYVCEADDVATPAKLRVVESYTEFMAGYLANLVSVPKVWSGRNINLHADDQGAPYSAGMAATMLAQLETSVYDGDSADLVVVVSMRPHSSGPDSGIEAYSSCLVRNQFRRCVVANINFCPAAVRDAPPAVQAAAVEARGFAVAVHEALHILNAVKPYGKFFIKPDGSQPLDAEVCVQRDGVRRVATPAVLAVARAQFACGALDGVAVEDSEFGLGLHWEAALAGSEIMAVGDFTGETYISDLTCAFLEDTGYYGCNYDALGSLTAGTALDAALAENIFSTENRDAIIAAFTDPFTSDEAKLAAEEERSRETTVTNRSVGYLRWGRDAGCEFLEGIPAILGVDTAIATTAAPVTATAAAAAAQQPRRALRSGSGGGGGDGDGDRRRQLATVAASEAVTVLNATREWESYLCASAFPEVAPEDIPEDSTVLDDVSRFFDNIELPESSAAGFCTYDNRMTAACGAKQVAAGSSTLAAYAAHCDPPTLDADASTDESYWTCSAPGSVELPVYHDDDGARVVGINPALEYAPVLVGYQSCRGLNFTQGFSVTNGARASLDAATIFDGMDEAGAVIIGDGQAHCENCRCFKSSLVPTTELLALQLAPAGRCYVTNCYHDTYLQVGLLTEEGLTWYKCPDGGGELLVPGFTGAITCPDPGAFCRQEEVTFVYMSETDSALQWVFWIGIVLAGAIVLVIIILIWGAIEANCRACCGLPPLEMYDLDGDGKADWKEYFEVHKKPCTAQVLVATNLVWVLAGLACLGCAIDIRFFGSSVVYYPGVQKHVAPFTAVGIALLVYGVLGTVVACEARPNFKTLSYFYCTLFTCFAVVFFAVGVYFLAVPVQAEVGKYWNELRWYFPDDIRDANYSAAVAMAEEFVVDNFWLFGLIAIIIFLNLALSVVFTGCAIQSKIIVENFELVFNIGVAVVSSVFIGFGLYYTHDLGNPNILAMLGILLVPLLVISVFGVIVFCNRNDKDAIKVYRCYVVYIFLLVMTLLLAVAFAVVLFLVADDFPALVAENFTQEQILQVINSWSGGESWGYEELMVWGAGLLRLSASAIVVIVIMLLFVLGATAAILNFNKRRGDRSKIGNELELQRKRTGPFWERVTYVFNYLDAFLNGLGDGVVTVGELRSFFRGDEDLADYFVTEIDGYARYRQDAWDLTAADDGQITLDEWYSFMDYLGDKTRKHAEEGLELFEKFMAQDPKYDRLGRRKGPFWERCNAAFDAVDSGPAAGDGVLTFAELKNFFKGDEELSNYFITNIDMYAEERKHKKAKKHSKKDKKDKKRKKHDHTAGGGGGGGDGGDSPDTTDDDSDDDSDLEAPTFAVSKGDGVITLAEWYNFFDFLLGINQIDALRALAKFERFMSTRDMAASTFAEGSKTGRPLAVQRTDPIWRRVNAVFDAIDAATASQRDGDVTVNELKKFFAQTPELQAYYEDKLQPHLRRRLADDSVVTLDEWYAHFDELARADPDCKDGDAASSLVVAAELTFLETQAGLLPASAAARPAADGGTRDTSFSHGKVWNRVRKVFDLADAQLHSGSDQYRDNELSMDELRAFFKGDNRVAERYLEDIDEFSHEATARDGFISLEEWHDYFQGVANKDETCPSNDVEASVEVRKKLEVFERYMNVTQEQVEAKLNSDDDDGDDGDDGKEKKKKNAKRLSEHYTESDSALLEAKMLARSRASGGSHAQKANRLESKIKQRAETKKELQEKRKRKKKKKSKKGKKKGNKAQVTPAGAAVGGSGSDNE